MASDGAEGRKKSAKRTLRANKTGTAAAQLARGGATCRKLAGG